MSEWSRKGQGRKRRKQEPLPITRTPPTFLSTLYSCMAPTTLFCWALIPISSSQFWAESVLGKGQLILKAVCCYLKSSIVVQSSNLKLSIDAT